jgi:hypothetical protein
MESRAHSRSRRVRFQNSLSQSRMLFVYEGDVVLLSDWTAFCPQRELHFSEEFKSILRRKLVTLSGGCNEYIFATAVSNR